MSNSQPETSKVVAYRSCKSGQEWEIILVEGESISTLVECQNIVKKQAKILAREKSEELGLPFAGKLRQPNTQTQPET